MIASRITPITSEEFLSLAREAEHRAHWQISEHNAERLFNWADMLRGLANRQRVAQGKDRTQRDPVRVWRSWEGGE